MNLFFTLLSGAYISVIFLGADSELAAQMTLFNPYSLLHIPLYASVTFLLLLAFSKRGRPGNWRVLLVFGIAGTVAALDEIHQLFMTQREGSMGDVLLDFTGISLMLLLALRIPLSYREKLFKVLSRLGIA